MKLPQFQNIIQTLVYLLDRGPIPRQQLIQLLGTHLAMDIFGKNILKLAFHGMIQHSWSYALEPSQEFIVDFQTRLHRKFCEMMLGKLHSPKREGVEVLLRKYYNFVLKPTVDTQPPSADSIS